MMRVRKVISGIGDRDEPMPVPSYLRRRSTVTRSELLKALEACDFNIVDTAKHLGQSYQNVRNAARRHGLYRPHRQRKGRNSPGRAKIEVDLGEVDRMQAQGITLAAIARKLCVSTDNIAARRREQRERADAKSKAKPGTS